ncbi:MULTISPECIES: hypothetical protein [Methylobacterium]|uniref:Uncharacterized protein n=2 Tax=Methylobacterium TaxID=407 RepID=A0A0C6F485_9HYPH|nr:hypothetical protein [Methylobacterium aquaticum]BAQ47486.1 hypothetical protein Maq22A_c22525 [Methylobacterium aquaticum]
MEILIVAALIGLIPAFVAQKKGRSFGLWWFYGAALFIVALPHALIMKPKEGSEEANKRKALEMASKGLTPVREPAVDFVADGVIGNTPYRNEPDGSVIAIASGRTIKFKNRDDLETMLRGAVS